MKCVFSVCFFRLVNPNNKFSSFPTLSSFLQLLLLVLISTSENSKKDVWEIWYEKRVELRCLFGEFLVNTNSIVIIIVIVVLGILFMVGFWLLMLSQNLLWTPVFFFLFSKWCPFTLFSLTHKRCFNNFFVMLVCLLLFRRYRLCLFCFFGVCGWWRKGSVSLKSCCGR